MISLSKKELSKAQQAYRDLFNELLLPYGEKSPFKLSKDDRAKFFAELKAKWRAAKQKSQSNVSTSGEDLELLKNLKSGYGNKVKKGNKDEIQKYNKEFQAQLKKQGYSKIESKHKGKKVYYQTVNGDMACITIEGAGDSFSITLVYNRNNSKSNVSTSAKTKRVSTDLRKQIERVSAAARKEGQYVEINTSVDDEVFVYRGEDGDEYTFRHNEARDLLNEVPPNVAAEDYILWKAQSW